MPLALAAQASSPDGRAPAQGSSPEGPRAQGSRGRLIALARDEHPGALTRAWDGPG